MLNVLVIHGYLQTGETMRCNTQRLQAELRHIAELHYVEGPPMKDSSWGDSRPWWIMKSRSGWLDPDNRTDRWDETVRWWSEHLSEHPYDGIIGLSQGSAMTALLLSMLKSPETVPGFEPKRTQSIKFAILCSGWVSRLPPHKEIYDIPSDLPTLHKSLRLSAAGRALDETDGIVSARRTAELASLFGPKAVQKSHNEGHLIPVRDPWPRVFQDFIASAVQENRARPIPES
ncbi:hypothetical protein CALVIDRAFT_530257 [Calocera viscosa TUFC12733]|uniref:Serine hydrolase domain-containing protein n=1 Tax=Calocera viscosa (strain TUFC12733) TaxID=1330018 RepID=A0A167I483_CALVF|nr:hypothetical protein CALVIDRAFT_530257 [Calocera viscosa TUFC12733]